MPPAAGAIIATVVSAGASYLASVGVISTLAAALITIGVTIATALLFRPGKPPNPGAEIRMKLDSSMPRQVACGLTATGGSLVWTYIQDTGGKVPNKFLWRVISLSDFPITNCLRIMEGRDVLAFEGDFHDSLVACSGHRSKKGAARMWVRVHRGSFTPTADADLMTASGGLWTANHKGVGQAYAIVKYEYDPDAFNSGEPQLTFVVEGAPLYDDRLDGSKPARTGDHRLNDVSTWEFSTNAALITAQFLRGFYVNGELIVGVQAEERDLPDSMLTSAYNVCDEVVDTLEGTAPRYQAGRMLTASEEAAEILTDLQIAMDGRIYDRGGLITLLPGAIRSPVLDLTDDDIVWTEEKHWQPISSQAELFNFLSGSYIDGTTNFDSAPYPPRTNSTWEADDGGERFSKTLDFNACPFLPQVQRIVSRRFASSRFQEVIGFVGPLWLLELEQGDLFTLTSDRWEMTEKLFQAEFVHILLETMQIAVIARETSDTIDEWDPIEDEVPPSDDTYVPPASELLPPDFTLDPYTETGPQGAQVGILITVTDDLEDTTLRGFQSQIAYASDLDTVWSGPTIDAEAGSAVAILTPELDYAVRLRTWDGNSFSDWSDWQYETTPTNTNPVGSANYVLKSGDTMTGSLNIALTDATARILLTRTQASDSGVVASVDMNAGSGIASSDLTSYRTSTATHCNFIGRPAYGSSTNPAQIGAANVSLFELSCRPLQSDLATWGQQARISFLSTAVHSSTSLGIYSTVDLTAEGSTTRTRSVAFYAGTGTSTIADVFEAAGNIKPSSDNVFSCGISGRRWSVIFAGSATINTSDIRFKRDVLPITDELLDAWEDVNWISYRFEDAYQLKGDGARTHFGLIAQQVRDAIDSKLGAGAAIHLGLLCYDSWPERAEETVPIMATRTEMREQPVKGVRFKLCEDGSYLPEEYDTGQTEIVPVDVEYDTGQVEIVQPYQPAGDAWGLRYTECFAIEAAYQRRRMKRLEEKLALLHKEN